MIIHETSERQKLYEFARNFLKARGVRTVLDAACGDGEGASILSKEKSFEVFGLDIDETLIKKARKNYNLPNLSFFLGDACKMDFKDYFFDAVVSSHTIEHFEESGQNLFLKEIRRVLKPRGLLFLATPDRDVWELQGIAGIQEDHLRELNRFGAERLIEKNGFEIQERYGQEILRQGNFFMRRILNFLKHMDIFKLRHFFLPKSFLGAVDLKTQPVAMTGNVEPLGEADKASINIFICVRTT